MKYGIALVTGIIVAAAAGYWYCNQEDEAVAPAEPETTPEEPAV